MIKAVIILIILLISMFIIFSIWAANHKFEAAMDKFPTWISLLGLLIGIDFVAIVICSIIAVVNW